MVAAGEKDSLLRLAYVAAFSSTIYASSANGARCVCEQPAFKCILRCRLESALELSLLAARSIYKPFNPILGETYELCDPVKGFRSISEQACALCNSCMMDVLADALRCDLFV